MHMNELLRAVMTHLIKKSAPIDMPEQVIETILDEMPPRVFVKLQSHVEKLANLGMNEQDIINALEAMDFVLPLKVMAMRPQDLPSAPDDASEHKAFPPDLYDWLAYNSDELEAEFASSGESDYEAFVERLYAPYRDEALNQRFREWQHAILVDRMGVPEQEAKDSLPSVMYSCGRGIYLPFVEFIQRGIPEEKLTRAFMTTIAETAGNHGLDATARFKQLVNESFPA